MNIEELVIEIDTLQNVAEENMPNIRFKYDRPFESTKDKPFCDWCFAGWPNYMPDNKSGIYFICSPKDEVVYIGKATTENLGAEIWGKFGKPDVGTNGAKIFSKSYFLNKNNMSKKLLANMELQKAIENGEVFISTIIIDPPYLSSLIEVYLQTVYMKKNGELPILNKKIG